MAIRREERAREIAVARERGRNKEKRGWRERPDVNVWGAGEHQSAKKSDNVLSRRHDLTSDFGGLYSLPFLPLAQQLRERKER